MSFSEKYNQILDIVKNDIVEIEDRIFNSIKLSTEIDELLKVFLSTNAKRIRPLLAFLYLRANNIEPTERHYDFLTAIEIIHNASLIHDDVVDESDTRRGVKSINSRFNNKVAILVGDYLLSNSLSFLNRINSPETIAICTKTLAGMCEGEVEQYFEKFQIPTLDIYLKKTEKKTAKLFETAVEGAMILSEVNELNLAKEFGYNFGMAFQIRDDIMNFRNSDELKPSQSDVKNGIYTAPVIFSGQIENVEAGFAKSQTLLSNYIDTAKKLLIGLQESSYKTGMLELLEILNDGKI